MKIVLGQEDKTPKTFISREDYETFKRVGKLFARTLEENRNDREWEVAVNCNGDISVFQNEDIVAFFDTEDGDDDDGFFEYLNEKESEDDEDDDEDEEDDESSGIKPLYTREYLRERYGDDYTTVKALFVGAEVRARRDITCLDVYGRDSEIVVPEGTVGVVLEAQNGESRVAWKSFNPGKTRSAVQTNNLTYDNDLLDFEDACSCGECRYANLQRATRYPHYNGLVPEHLGIS